MRRKKIVTIGGGTGHYALLTGLKRCPFEITAIVSMADDGGSTGVLRDELGVLPPGDVRQCLVALSDSSLSLRRLFTYRFDRGGLAGHSFGNLLLSALEKLTGDFETAIDEARKILKVSHTVLPVTRNKAHLVMQLRDGTVLRGEHAIDTTNIQKGGIRKFFYKPSVTLSPRARKAIREADLIVIGPGSHFSSVVPNLLVRGMSSALATSRAKIVYIANITNKKGHTEGYTAVDYGTDIERHLGTSLDVIIANTGRPARKAMRPYEAQEGKSVMVAPGSPPRRARYSMMETNVLSAQEYRADSSDKLARHRSLIRHDGEKLGHIITSILNV